MVKVSKGVVITIAVITFFILILITWLMMYKVIAKWVWALLFVFMMSVSAGIIILLSFTASKKIEKEKKEQKPALTTDEILKHLKKTLSDDPYCYRFVGNPIIAEDARIGNESVGTKPIFWYKNRDHISGELIHAIIRRDDIGSLTVRRGISDEQAMKIIQRMSDVPPTDEQIKQSAVYNPMTGQTNIETVYPAHSQRMQKELEDLRRIVETRKESVS